MHQSVCKTTLTFISSESEKLEKTQILMKAKVQKLMKDEELMEKIISAMVKFYKTSCLVDKSKHDAVRLYLIQSIALGRIENRKQEVDELEQVNNKFTISLFRFPCLICSLLFFEAIKSA